MNYSRCLYVIVTGCLLGGCATDVVLMDPRTGTSTVCRESLRGVNPWSQQEACVGEHLAKGWVKAYGP